MRRFVLKASVTIICFVLIISVCTTVMADSTTEGITITIKKGTTDHEIPYEDAGYATLYPSSIYGIVYRMNKRIDGFTEVFPDMAFDYPTVADFSIDEERAENVFKFRIFEFQCVIPFKMTVIPDDQDDLLSDWEVLSLEWNPSDWPSTVEDRYKTSLVFIALIQACDTSLTDDEAIAIVSILLQEFHAIDYLNNMKKEYNGIYYDMYTNLDVKSELSISR